MINKNTKGKKVTFHSIKKIHQIFIDDTLCLPKKNSYSIECSQQSARDIYPESEYKLWCGQEIRTFIKEKFDNDVLFSFDKLAAYAFKCDLARYCLMYYYGGIYFDLSIIMENYWEIPSHCKVAAFLEQYENMPLWTNTQQSLLWSLPQQREWELAIQYIVKNCQESFYGSHDHYVTGPALLGRCMAQVINEQGITSDANSQYLGEVRYITPESKNKNCVFVSPDCALIAHRNKTTAGSVKEIGIDKGNSYPDLWKSKKIYGENTSKWLACDEEIRVTGRAKKNEHGIHIEKGKKDRATFGPYINLSSGKYNLIIFCTKNSNFIFSKIEIASNESTLFSRRVTRHKTSKESKKIKIIFKIKNKLDNVEFRFCASSFSYGTIKSIELIGPIVD